jgi:glycosyltransferase involved in cell wall biosynthesis
MHILFISDNFPPEVNAPASRTFEHCREWVKAGHEVTVLTGAPNFPAGKVYEGYSNRCYQTEVMEGIRVVRVWTYISANAGVVRRILDYVSFMFSAIVAAPFSSKVDLIVATSPQFFSPCAAYVISLYKRVPFIFELRDFWPESIEAVGAMRESPALRLLERLELFLYRKAARIVVVSPAFKTRLVERGIDDQKIDVVTNGVDLTNFTPRKRDESLAASLNLSGCFVAGYIGTHGLAHGLDTLLDAAELLQTMPEADDVRILFLGDGARKAELVSSARNRGLRNVVFQDSVPKAEVPHYWSLLDVSIIHLRKTELFGLVIPSKLFECMGMGIPVLHGVAGESAGIVETERVGLVFEPENSQQLVEGLLRLRADRGLYETYRDNCLAAARKYDRKTLALTMLGILEGVVSGKKA